MDACITISGESAQILSAVGGLLGGTSMMMYMRPSSSKEALGRVALSVVSAVMLSSIAATKLFSDTSSETIMGTAFAIGFVAWSILGAVAKFFEGRQDKDIVEMLRIAKGEEPGK